MQGFEALKPDEQSRQLARETLDEDPAEKMSKLDTLRSWIVTHPYLECRTDDKFLLRFLRVSKFSCDAAKDRIHKYCLLRSSPIDGVPEWFNPQDMSDSKVRFFLNQNAFYLMPKPDDLGRLVLVFDMDQMNVKQFKENDFQPIDFVRGLFMVMDWIVHTFERAQIHGVALIDIGSNNFDPDHMSYWTLERMKKSMELWQGALPLRIKLIHYYNMPVILRPLIEMGIRFMKPKLAKRVKFHSDKKRDENIPEDCMPPTLNGTVDTDAVSQLLINAMEEFQPEFDGLKMCKVDDAKRPKHYEEGDSWGIAGTYRSIAKDD